jgi:hypothetical protein
MSQGDCQICCTVHLTPARRVRCPFCDQTACRTCVETYLCGSSDDAACMFCHNAWGAEHLETLMTKSFLGGVYKDHRRNVLFDREMSLLPATQPYLEQEVQRRKNVKLLQDMTRERNELKRKVDELDQTMHTLERNLQPRLDTSKRSFVHRCGRTNCTGWLSAAWKCASCEHYTCPDCNAVKGLVRDAPHECDPEARASIALIRKDCKKCPGCGQYIQRVEGCAQMWCTECHTAFDYITGAKINGNIHNPHWYEFQRTVGPIPRLAGDVPCGGFPHFHEVSVALRNDVSVALRNDASREVATSLLHMHRLITHIEDRELRSYPTEIPVDANVTLRVAWMMGENNRAAMQRQLQIREKAASKKRDIGLVLRMVVDASADLMRQYVLEWRSDADLELQDASRSPTASHVVAQLRQLFLYANTALEGVSRRYGCVVPHIHIHRFNIFKRNFTIRPHGAAGPSATGAP